MAPGTLTSVASNRDVNRVSLFLFKSQPCVRCANEYETAQMDCDHVRGVKTANVSDMMDVDPVTFVLELAKCDPTCANCHRQRTQEERLDRHVDAALDAEIDDLLTDLNLR